MPLLIDCYNVLHADMPPILAGLDEAGLCVALSRSPWARGRTTIVCDGKVKPHSPAESPVQGVELIYSGPDRSADDVIMDMIDADTAPRRLVVVSNDHQIQKAARRRRCKVLPVEEFISRLAAAQEQQVATGRSRARGGAPKPSGKRSGPLGPNEVAFWLKQFGFTPGETPRSPSDQDKLKPR